ncbi:hypothetical protein F5887DRAFT_1073443 [Amanita rubescens]|nr:hypothetical protein F5887DRAFT_928576 [Amanita rubescens]KAF8329655.1 hypothetical protein F5887DRAFT_923663 [Amanita rubescens]KAF8329956.1 hypothetical protein F5887DRAFT_923458 [Amanita rubescens]KAF8344892.1 hypothetical protein F5887DRAFT_917684 [Amanita rubescens]KAF8346774.1 hypothetical protein F5887DRAFT_1073443 [Amanita rubescens]
MPSERKPLPPNMDELKRRTKQLWVLGFNDLDILHNLKDFYDTNAYQLGAKKFRKLRHSWGFESARSCSLSDEEIQVKFRLFKQDNPNAGAGRIVKHLLTRHKVRVPKSRISKILRRIEPEAVLQRKPKIF